MRVRDETKHSYKQTGSGIAKQYYDNGDFHANSHYSPTGYGYVRKVNRIVDEILPRSNKSTRYCAHDSYSEASYPFSGIVENACSPGYYQVWSDMVILYSELENRGFPDFPQVSWLRLNVDLMPTSFNSRAWQAMKPSLEGDVSLTNFLLEMRDLKHISRFFTSKSDLSKKISEGHLTWSFGIKPMINDLAEIWNTLFNFENRIHDFLKRSKTPQKRYFSEDVADSTDGMKTVGSGCILWYTDWNAQWTVKRVATMAYTYDIEEVEILYNEIKALRAMLGLRFTPSVIWEAIPFSFVVDWFLNVQQWLESRESDIFEPDVIIEDYSVSYKISFDVKGNFHYPTRTGGWSVFQFYAANGSIYNRRRVLPDTDGQPLELSLLSSNQLALSASLINVMRR